MFPLPISTVVHFKFIHYLFTSLFSHVHEDAKGKETDVTNKGDCCECLTIREIQQA